MKEVGTLFVESVVRAVFILILNLVSGSLSALFVATDTPETGKDSI